MSGDSAGCQLDPFTGNKNEKGEKPANLKGKLK